MGIAERKIRQKEEVKSAILDTAWQLVKKEGWQQLSIRKIADAIEYSVPVIYDHFENKEAILFEIGKQGFQLLSKKMQQAKDKHTDPADEIIKKNKVPVTNACLKYHTFWSVIHGLISIKMMRGSDTSDDLNKMVLDDAVAGIIKNLER